LGGSALTGAAFGGSALTGAAFGGVALGGDTFGGYANGLSGGGYTYLKTIYKKLNYCFKFQWYYVPCGR
jgi:hypothetical protein